jgi:hypothetical protein
VYEEVNPNPPPNGLSHFSFTFSLPFILFFIPAAEVFRPSGNESRIDLLAPALSPLLSPSFSSDEDSIYSPNATVTTEIQIDDLFDWDGQHIFSGTM